MGLASPRPDDRRGARRHHLSSVADAFLSPDPVARPDDVDRPALIVASPGMDASEAAMAALDEVPLPRSPRELGDRVGVRLSRWEQQGLDDGVGPGGVLIWCVQGVEATSLAASLSLGRLAALLAPLAITIAWLPASTGADGNAPPAALRGHAERLASAAVPGTRVAVHCLGWGGDLAGDMGDLARRFA
ncbi:hypothetical protein GF314_11220 [bacterium]|nr:hypothetical protein [bacterium]